MALKDPVAVYNAANNVEAQMICNHLVAEGIEAFAVEDVSQVGTWGLGLIPEIHKPQVFVDRWNADEARSLIEDYEDRAGASDSDTLTDEFCYGCGEPVTRGSLSCTACGKPLDWSEDPRDAEREDSPFVSMKELKKPIAWIYLSPIVAMIVVAVLGALSALFGLISR